MGGDVFDKRDKYSLLLAASLRRTALLLAVFVGLFMLAAQLGYVAVSPLYNPFSSAVIILIAVVSAAWMYANRRTHDADTVRLFVVPFHIIALLVPLTITGFMSPLTAFWAILIAVTDTLVSRKAMLYSMLSLLATVYLCLSLQGTVSQLTIAAHLIFTMIIIVIASFMVTLQSVQSLEHQDFVREKAQRSSQQNQLLTLINSVNEAILSIDSRGIVQLYNAAALNLLDTNQSLTGKKLSEVLTLVDEDDKPVRLLSLLRKGTPSIVRNDLTHHFSDGETISVAMNSSRIRNGDNEIEGYILVLRDITRDKSLEEERDEFISVVSHELRTPVTITGGTLSNVKLLIQKGATPRVVSDAITTAHEQTLYLSRMINDLSTLSRAERGIGSDAERIDVLDLVRSLYNEYRPKAAAKQLSLNIDVSPSLGHITASRLYLEEVLQNFLTNAVKYTDTGSITLSARQARGEICFAVRDTGIGIRKAEQDKIFDKFYRAEDYRTREKNGTGLGLYIVDKLARKLGTTVEVESQLNHGSEFRFALPVDKREPEA